MAFDGTSSYTILLIDLVDVALKVSYVMRVINFNERERLGWGRAFPVATILSLCTSNMVCDHMIFLGGESPCIFMFG